MNDPHPSLRLLRRRIGSMRSYSYLLLCKRAIQSFVLLSGILAKVNKLNKYILILHKHKLISLLTHIGISLSTGGISLCWSMCVSYGISLCLCEITIYLFSLFTFAKIADNNIRRFSSFIIIKMRN